MKKGNIIIGVLALAAAIGSAFASKVQTGPGDLWYYNSNFVCVKAPCSKVDQGPANVCNVGQLYNSEGCIEPYNQQAWVTDGGN